MEYIIGMKIKEVKVKVKKWGKKDWKRMVNEKGVVEINNRCGGVDYVLSKEKYFGGLEKVESFGELEEWFMMICGENVSVGFGEWLDEVLGD